MKMIYFECGTYSGQQILGNPHEYRIRDFGTFGTLYIPIIYTHDKERINVYICSPLYREFKKLSRSPEW